MWRKKKPAQTDAPAEPVLLNDIKLLRRVEWTTLRPLATHLGGSSPSLIHGAGLEVTEVREYQPGDDVRQIDWNITARSDKPYVRESLVERALEVWLILDLSASVNWGTALASKQTRLTEFVSAVGQLLGRQQNRLGAILFAQSPPGLIPPAGGRPHLLKILASLSAKSKEATSGATDLTAALKLAEAVIKRKAVLLVVSDFLVEDGWQSQLAKLARRHEVVAVQLSDPRESELVDVGIITLEDPETGQQLVVDTGNASIRARFNAAARAQADQLETDLRQSGATRLTLSTNTELLPALLKFLADRKQMKNLRGKR